MKKVTWIFILFLTLGFVAGGCGKASGSASAKAFDNAKAEDKAAWEKVLAADANKDYVPAVIISSSLLSKEQLTPEQRTTVEKKLTDIYTKLNADAGKGDKKAQDALAELKNASRRR